MTTTTLQYTADGTQSAFAFTFWLQRASDLAVYLAGVVQTAGYSVDILTDQDGGTVTFATAPAAGVVVTLARATEPVRRTLFVDGGAVQAADLNVECDTLYAILQEVANRLGATVIAWPSPAAANRAVLMTAAGALTLSLEDPDTVAARATTALNNAAAARAVADQALAATRPELGAELSVYTHTLVAGTTSYACAPAGLPAPAAANVLVHYDGVMLIPSVDYTLAVDGLSIVLGGDVVSGAPAADEFKAGLALVCVKIAGGMITPDLSPSAVGTTEIADEAVTAAKEAGGTAHAVRVYDADGRPAGVTGTSGQYLRFGTDGVPAAGGGPSVANAAEVRAATDATKIVPPSLIGYSPFVPLFIGRWSAATVVGAMSLAWSQSTAAGAVALSRTAAGKYRLTHPAMTAAPLVTFLATAAGSAPLRSVVFLESSTVTVIESWSGDSPIDAGVVVALFGSLV